MVGVRVKRRALLLPHMSLDVLLILLLFVIWYRRHAFISATITLQVLQCHERLLRTTPLSSGGWCRMEDLRAQFNALKWSSDYVGLLFITFYEYAEVD